ncbi:hypothetical protein HII36_05720 [Nonomuraea sp. NN258]|uniref:hypothetical protein n=1 Tax=Nonomuraea antri TaxID=2730852 RepID=UPI00156A2B26|nr:hypothetical protein [Nonomuraea antri]NRQ31337.1 hypothetical protein [Nonomuraea antri]
MPTGILRWEDPARVETRTTDEYAQVAAALRANPHKWAVIAENPDTVEGRRNANRLFNGVKKGYRGFRHDPTGTFQVTTRTVARDDGTKAVLVYVQYVPHS